MRLEIEEESDGRWLAEAPDLPGVMAYGATRAEAIARVETLALRVLADRLEHGERIPELDALFSFRVTAWPTIKAKRLLAALLRAGWTVKRQSGSHRVLERQGFPDFVFAFHDNEEIGPRMLARIAKHTGLTPDDL